MARNSGIEWCDDTWNPVRGCSRVSEGCRNCYAERLAARFSGWGKPYDGFAKRVGGEARWTGNIRLIEGALDLPLRWRKPRRIFTNSMSDLFHEKLPDQEIDRVFAVMALCPQHTFQVLTKRPERMRAYTTDKTWGRVTSAASSILSARASADIRAISWNLPAWPLPSVWLGVSVENQETADERIPLLLDTPAAVHFISAEPLLGPINLTDSCDGWQFADFLRGRRWHDGPPAGTIRTEEQGGPHLDWVIAGGESGPGARPCHPKWRRSLRDQCAAAGVAFFDKQAGEWADMPEDEAPRGVKFGVFRSDRFFPGEIAAAENELTMYRVGKKAAGATLDGREHREFPA